MIRQFKEDEKYNYCVLGPHRLQKRGYKISLDSLYPSFKAYNGETWTAYHPEAELCSKCQAKVRNYGRKVGVQPEVSVMVQASEDVAPSTPDDIEMIEGELSNAEDMPIQSSSSGSCSSSSEASFYSAQDMTPGSSHSMSCHYSGSEASHSLGSVASGSTDRTTYQLTSISACTLSQRYCMVCGEEGKDSRHRIPKAVVRHLWHGHRILASTESRSCLVHHNGIQFSADAIVILEASVRKRTVNLDEDTLYDWIAAVTFSGGTGPKYVFDDDVIPNSKYPALVGISKESFDDLLSHIQGHMRNSCNRTKRQALAMWLMLMKSVVTQEHLAMDFGVDQKTVSNACKVVGDLIHRHFTPQNLGFGSISKEEVIQDHNRKTTQIALSIPEGKIISIADGTYLYVDKPVGHEEQRLTFNAQKMCNFYRMMMFVACSGRILDCIGPFPATWNDSKALEWFLDHTGFLEFMGDGTIILDRGFRSCEPKLREKGLTVFSPEWLSADEKQMSVEKGAKSRLVTMCRWQVEGANGRVKQKFRFFMDTIPGRYSVNISMWFMNVCAIVNKYGASGFTETDRNIGFAKEAVERAKLGRNELCDMLRDAGKIKCTAAWKKMDASSLADFPRLTYDDLENASLGSYHANEARRYIAEHLKPTGMFELRYHREFSDIVRAQIHSRFQSATIHSAWIKYLPNQNGPAAILDHYCTCRAGARKVSCCAHIATALRFLGLDRYAEELIKRKSNRVKFLGIAYPDNTA